MRDVTRQAAADHHWAAVSQASQMLALCRTPVRARLGGWLVRAGLRLAGPLTVEHVLLHRNEQQVA